jgi:hypothetical protein
VGRNLALEQDPAMGVAQNLAMGPPGGPPPNPPR